MKLFALLISQEVESSDLDNLRRGDWFVIEFRVKQSDLNQVQFDGDVSVGPKAKMPCRRACKVSFGISENFLIMVSLFHLLIHIPFTLTDSWPTVTLIIGC